MKKKIAMIGHKDISIRNGGVEVVVKRLGAGLVKKGYCVTAYNRKSHQTVKRKFFHGIRMRYVLTIDVKGLAAVTSSLFATIYALCDKNDVYHFHAEGPSAMAWIPKLFGKKVIVTIHGLDYKRDKWGKFGKIYIKLGEKIAVKYADDIIVLSKNMQNYFMTNYNRETVYIPNGIDKVRRRDVNKIRKWNLNKDSYILFVGRIVPEKGLTELIQAYDKIKTDKKLVIAGGSSDSDSYFKELKHSCRTNQVVFTGYVKGEELDELYSNAYFFVLPSRLEGMPMSLLEAMAFGNFCLVSNIPECTEVIQDKGITFKVKDVGDLYKKMKYICCNPQIVLKYKNESSKYIYKNFSWDSIIDKTIKLYEMDEIDSN